MIRDRLVSNVLLNRPSGAYNTRQTSAVTTSEKITGKKISDRYDRDATPFRLQEEAQATSPSRPESPPNTTSQRTVF